jgi:hypothetical protein
VCLLIRLAWGIGDRGRMPSLPSAPSNYRVIASAIGQELPVRYEPPNGLSSELRSLLGQIPRSDTVRKPHRSHDMSHKQEETMIRTIAVALFGLALASAAQAMTPAPIPQEDATITKVAFGCGLGRTRVGGVCVARTTIRQVRRCARWHGGLCAVWY